MFGIKKGSLILNLVKKCGRISSSTFGVIFVLGSY